MYTTDIFLVVLMCEPFPVDHQVALGGISQLPGAWGPGLRSYFDCNWGPPYLQEYPVGRTPSCLSLIMRHRRMGRARAGDVTAQDTAPPLGAGRRCAPCHQRALCFNTVAIHWHSIYWHSMYWHWPQLILVAYYNHHQLYWSALYKFYLQHRHSHRWCHAGGITLT